MWPRGGQKEKEETESENRPYTLNTHSEAEGGGRSLQTQVLLAGRLQV